MEQHHDDQSPHPQAPTPDEASAQEPGGRVPQWVAELVSPLDQKLGTEFLEVAPERVVARAPVEGNTQIHGIWHGGASGVMVETLGSVAAAAHARLDGRAAVGMELNVTHHRPGVRGWITGVATPVHVGSRVGTYAVELTDDRQRRIATGRLTCMFVSGR